MHINLEDGDSLLRVQFPLTHREFGRDKSQEIKMKILILSRLFISSFIGIPSKNGVRNQGLAIIINHPALDCIVKLKIP